MSLMGEALAEGLSPAGQPIVDRGVNLRHSTPRIVCPFTANSTQQTTHRTHSCTHTHTLSIHPSPFISPRADTFRRCSFPRPGAARPKTSRTRSELPQCIHARCTSSLLHTLTRKKTGGTKTLYRRVITIPRARAPTSLFRHCHGANLYFATRCILRARQYDLIAFDRLLPYVRL